MATDDPRRRRDDRETRLRSLRSLNRNRPLRLAGTVFLYLAGSTLYLRLLLLGGSRSPLPIPSRALEYASGDDGLGEELARLTEAAADGGDARSLSNVMATNGWIEAAEKAMREREREERMEAVRDRAEEVVADGGGGSEAGGSEAGGGGDGGASFPKGLTRRDGSSVAADEGETTDGGDARSGPEVVGKGKKTPEGDEGGTDGEGAEGEGGEGGIGAVADPFPPQPGLRGTATGPEPERRGETPVHSAVLLALLLIALFVRISALQMGAAPWGVGRTTTTTTTTGGPASAVRYRREARFRAAVDRINAERAANGERPISAESLRLALSRRDFTGEDYESLLRFNEESGPAAMALLGSTGATNEEIERCPRRTIDSAGDDLMTGRAHGDGGADGAGAGGSGRRGPRPCAVCLEPFQVGDEVRTVQCFHTFHRECIDPWLRQKAECPVCKHPAVG